MIVSNDRWFYDVMVMMRTMALLGGSVFAGLPVDEADLFSDVHRVQVTSDTQNAEHLAQLERQERT